MGLKEFFDKLFGSSSSAESTDSNQVGTESMPESSAPESANTAEPMSESSSSPEADQPAAEEENKEATM